MTYGTRKPCYHRNSRSMPVPPGAIKLDTYFITYESLYSGIGMVFQLVAHHCCAILQVKGCVQAGLHRQRAGNLRPPDADRTSLPSVALCIHNAIYHTIHTLTLTLALTISLTLNLTIISSYLTNKHQYAIRDMSIVRLLNDVTVRAGKNLGFLEKVFRFQVFFRFLGF